MIHAAPSLLGCWIYEDETDLQVPDCNSCSVVAAALTRYECGKYTKAGASLSACLSDCLQCIPVHETSIYFCIYLSSQMMTRPTLDRFGTAKWWITNSGSKKGKNITKMTQIMCAKFSDFLGLIPRKRRPHSAFQWLRTRPKLPAEMSTALDALWRGD